MFFIFSSFWLASCLVIGGGGWWNFQNQNQALSFNNEEKAWLLGLFTNYKIYKFSKGLGNYRLGKTIGDFNVFLFFFKFLFQ